MRTARGGGARKPQPVLALPKPSSKASVMYERAPGDARLVYKPDATQSAKSDDVDARWEKRAKGTHLNRILDDATADFLDFHQVSRKERKNAANWFRKEAKSRYLARKTINLGYFGRSVNSEKYPAKERISNNIYAKSRARHNKTDLAIRDANAKKRGLYIDLDSRPARI